MPHTPLSSVRIGCAGWSVPRSAAEKFGKGSSHLQRYATRFTAVEINSSFYRPHRPATYERWAASVPEGFQFAVKVPKQITHVEKLEGPALSLVRFLDECGMLGDKLGPLLIQLPPSMAFSEDTVKGFLNTLRGLYDGYAVCEPRHDSWFTAEAENVLAEFQVARVAADPARTPRAAEPGGWDGLAYYRLHGSPRIYYSAYPRDVLDSLSEDISSKAATSPVWCIFDNTAEGEAATDALYVQTRLRDKGLLSP